MTTGSYTDSQSSLQPDGELARCSKNGARVPQKCAGCGEVKVCMSMYVQAHLQRVRGYAARAAVHTPVYTPVFTHANAPVQTTHPTSAPASMSALMSKHMSTGFEPTLPTRMNTG